MPDLAIHGSSDRFQDVSLAVTVSVPGADLKRSAYKRGPAL